MSGAQVGMSLWQPNFVESLFSNLGCTQSEYIIHHFVEKVKVPKTAKNDPLSKQANLSHIVICFDESNRTIL